MAAHSGGRCDVAGGWGVRIAGPSAACMARGDWEEGRTIEMDANDYPPILDAAHVSELLGMNVQMVRKYAREGRIPAYRLPGGRTFRFFRDEIFGFLREHPVVESVDGAAKLQTASETG